ncbi:MAG: hypothetical protein IPK32_25590 [Verrucomicrobiaceae bacterium]|nr:hypothetical protein [Verrucomicrobiaceae bacterium]
MSTRRRTTYRNRLGLPALMVILVVVASLACVGLLVVISKNRVRALGEEQRKVESEIRLLKDEIIRLEQSREKAFTSQRLQPRLVKIATLLRPLEKDRIILLPPVTQPQKVATESEGPPPAALPVTHTLAQNSSPP